MKTNLKIYTFALLGFVLASCSSSMYMSKTSVTPTDDIYYTPSKTSSILASYENTTPINIDKQEPSKLNLAKLEKKYSEVLDSDTGKIDTLIYTDESSNPYERILSDSYQESYERRLRGMEDPRYGMENFTTRYSDDYFYASAYDPSLYNVVVMGNQVWVEPWYISSMFFWPRHHFSFGIGLGYGWNTWGWSPWYSNYYNPYFGYNNLYGWDPYYWNSNYYTGNYNNYNNYNYYGRRTGGSTTNTTPSIRSGRSYENQIISTRRQNGITSATTNRRDVSNNTTLRTRNTTQNEAINRNQRTNNSQEVTRRNNRIGDMNTTRLRGDSPNRNSGLNTTEPTRRNNTTTIQRPRSTTNEDYIRSNTRNQNVSNGSVRRDVNTRTVSPTRENRNSTPTYNKPNRVGTSTTKEKSTSSGSSRRESSYSKPSSSSNSSSGSSTRSSSSSSGSSSNSSSGSSSSSRRR